MGELIAIFGPSGVGKSTLIEHLVNHHIALRAFLATTRQRRIGEHAVGVEFLCEQSFQQRAIEEGWQVYQIGDWRYGLDLVRANELLDHGHVIVDAAPSTIECISKNAQGLRKILIWPENFEAMQVALRLAKERTEAERRARLAANEKLRSDCPKADLTLIARMVSPERVGDEIARLTSEFVRFIDRCTMS